MIENRLSLGHAFAAFWAHSVFAFLEAFGRGKSLPAGEVKKADRIEKHWLLKWVVIQLSEQLRLTQSIPK
jgi:hypothetical protein